MFWFLLGHFVAFLVDLALGTRPGDRDKDLQILVLRHQLRLAQRQRPRPPRLTRGEQLTLAVLAAALARLTTGPRSQLDRYLLLFKPDTILKWHRELIRRKWTYQRTNRGGRPAISSEVEGLILRLARENPPWGHRRIQGELAKLGHPVSASAVRAALRRHRVPPAPQRRRATTWREFINRHKAQLLACDFVTVETLFLKTLYALFFLPWNPIYPGIAAMAAGAAAMLWCRPDLRRKTWVGGLLFLAYYIVFLQGLRLTAPGYIERVWNLSDLSGVLVAGMPIEELLFAIGFGMYWSGVYEHFTWRQFAVAKPS